jgi:hypothetical protein
LLERFALQLAPVLLSFDLVVPIRFMPFLTASCTFETALMPELDLVAVQVVSVSHVERVFDGCELEVNCHAVGVNIVLPGVALVRFHLRVDHGVPFGLQ